MIKVSVMYPNGEGATFDIDYYCTRHMPMVKERAGDAIKSIGVELGIGGAVPGSPPPYLAMGHMTAESLEAFQEAFMPHVQEFMADVPNYTNTQPVVQISEIKL